MTPQNLHAEPSGCSHFGSDVAPLGNVVAPDRAGGRDLAKPFRASTGMSKKVGIQDY